jgi:hypothetical protein
MWKYYRPFLFSHPNLWFRIFFYLFITLLQRKYPLTLLSINLFTSPKMVGKGFLDLPPELRVQIYGHLLPIQKRIKRPGAAVTNNSTPYTLYEPMDSSDARVLIQTSRLIKSEMECEALKYWQQEYKNYEARLIMQLMTPLKIQTPQTYAETRRPRCLYIQLPASASGYDEAWPVGFLIMDTFQNRPGFVQQFVIESYGERLFGWGGITLFMEEMEWAIGLGLPQGAVIEYSEEYECDVEKQSIVYFEPNKPTIVSPCIFSKLEVALLQRPSDSAVRGETEHLGLGQSMRQQNFRVNSNRMGQIVTRLASRKTVCFMEKDDNLHTREFIDMVVICIVVVCIAVYFSCGAVIVIRYIP